MKFGITQFEKFNALSGSYSLVTNREVYDCQITATDAEADLLVGYFHRHNEDIYVGNVHSNRQAAMKRFRLYPNGEYVGLNLVYPKPEKSELRLYIAKRRGFMPAKGQVWFLFVDKHDNLWIGAMDEVQWRRFNSFDVNEECSGGEINGRPDESKLAQEETRANISSLYTPPAEILTPTVHETATILAEDKNATEDKIRRRCLLRRTSDRNQEVVKKCLERAKYSCEYSIRHTSFRGRSTGCTYMEAHHVIPMNLQYKFLARNMNLDRLENLCCICPLCHSAVHHADTKIAQSILSKLFDVRGIGTSYGIDKLTLYQMYGVEDIVRDDNPVIATDVYAYDEM